MTDPTPERLLGANVAHHPPHARLGQPVTMREARDLARHNNPDQFPRDMGGPRGWHRGVDVPHTAPETKDPT